MSVLSVGDEEQMGWERTSQRDRPIRQKGIPAAPRLGFSSLPPPLEVTVSPDAERV